MNAPVWTAAISLVATLAQAQVCRLSVAGLNRARRVTGAIHAECPSPLPHSAPFGNWGATSNFGPKRNGHQFDGWCHDIRVCDNSGICRDVCQDGWYEWNSCTDHSQFAAPNCSLYNDKDCTAQVTTTDVNVLGTQTVDVPVSCPIDADGDGVPDTGGCKDVRFYSHGGNFMSLYELDPLTGDELVQSVYFPPTVVTLNCAVLSCPGAGSDWTEPASYDSPASPGKVFAEMALVVNSGTYVDNRTACSAAQPPARAVSAASFSGLSLAPDSIAALFGTSLSETNAAAPMLPLPVMLGGVSLRITDASGASRLAPLFAVSPSQINFAIPAGVASGTAMFAIDGPSGPKPVAQARIDRVGPGVFSATADGQGAPAAFAVRVSPNGEQTYIPASPLEFGPGGDQLVLVLYGTGIRGRSALSSVRVAIGGIESAVLYAGPVEGYAGLDQVNVLAPRALAGHGEVNIALTVDEKPANVTRIIIR